MTGMYTHTDAYIQWDCVAFILTEQARAFTQAKGVSTLLLLLGTRPLLCPATTAATIRLGDPGHHLRYCM